MGYLMKRKSRTAVLYAILAALLYAISAPISKILLGKISPTMLAALLYLGSGLGLTLVGVFKKLIHKEETELSLTKKDLPYTIGMVVLDIAAPILLMVGLSKTSAANVALLNNFEIVATAIIALLIFKENISKRLWLAISLVTISSMLISIESIDGFSFSIGSLFVILACVCWGFENNCTRMISSKNPIQIVMIKGFCSGVGSLLIAISLGERVSSILYMLIALCLGFLSYGLSIFFYIYAQRDLGAAKTSTYYAVTPFIGVFISFLVFNEMPTILFVIAFLIMIIGAYFASIDFGLK